MQDVNDCASRRHSNVEPASFEVKLKDADVPEIELEVIVVSGATESEEIVHSAWAGVESGSESRLIARTSNV